MYVRLDLFVPENLTSEVMSLEALIVHVEHSQLIYTIIVGHPYCQVDLWPASRSILLFEFKDRDWTEIVCLVFAILTTRWLSTN